MMLTYNSNVVPVAKGAFELVKMWFLSDYRQRGCLGESRSYGNPTEDLPRDVPCCRIRLKE